MYIAFPYIVKLRALSGYCNNVHSATGGAGGGHSGTEWLPSVKWPRRAEAVNDISFEGKKGVVTYNKCNNL